MFDGSIRQETNDLVNSAPEIRHCNEFKKEHGLLCAMMDRLFDVLDYFERVLAPPETKKEIMVFLMYAGMLVDTVQHAFKHLGIEDKWKRLTTGREDYFGDVRTRYLDKFIGVDAAKRPDDDRFFAYIRSLAIAHPVDTTRQGFIINGAIHFSPEVMTPFDCELTECVKDAIGIRVYTSYSSRIEPLIIPFEKMMAYLDSRYRMVSEINAHLREFIRENREKWRLVKIKRVESLMEQLQIICKALDERGRNSEFAIVRELLELLSTQTQHIIGVNLSWVQEFRNKLICRMPTWADMVDVQDYDGLARDMTMILYPWLAGGKMSERLKNLYCEIDSNMGEFMRTNERCHFVMAEKAINPFVKEIGSSCFTIDTKVLSPSEILLLANVAMHCKIGDLSIWGLSCDVCGDGKI